MIDLYYPMKKHWNYLLKQKLLYTTGETTALQSRSTVKCRIFAITGQVKETVIWDLIG